MDSGDDSDSTTQSTQTGGTRRTVTRGAASALQAEQGTDGKISTSLKESRALNRRLVCRQQHGHHPQPAATAASAIMNFGTLTGGAAGPEPRVGRRDSVVSMTADATSITPEGKHLPHPGSSTPHGPNTFVGKRTTKMKLSNLSTEEIINARSTFDRSPLAPLFSLFHVTALLTAYGVNHVPPAKELEKLMLKTSFASTQAATQSPYEDGSGVLLPFETFLELLELLKRGHARRVVKEDGCAEAFEALNYRYRTTVQNQNHGVNSGGLQRKDSRITTSDETASAGTAQTAGGRSGAIPLQHLEQLVKSTGIEYDFRALLTSVDTAFDGNVTAAQFRWCAGSEDPSIVSAFVALGGESDLSGTIPCDMLLTKCGAMGMTPQFIANFIQEIDTNGDGMVDYSEFLTMVVRHKEGKDQRSAPEGAGEARGRRHKRGKHGSPNNNGLPNSKSSPPTLGLQGPAGHDEAFPRRGNFRRESLQGAGDPFAEQRRRSSLQIDSVTAASLQFDQIEKGITFDQGSNVSEETHTSDHGSRSSTDGSDEDEEEGDEDQMEKLLSGTYTEVNGHMHNHAHRHATTGMNFQGLFSQKKVEVVEIKSASERLATAVSKCREKMQMQRQRCARYMGVEAAIPNKKIVTEKDGLVDVSTEKGRNKMKYYFGLKKRIAPQFSRVSSRLVAQPKHIAARLHLEAEAAVKPRAPKGTAPYSRTQVCAALMVATTIANVAAAITLPAPDPDPSSGRHSRMTNHSRNSSSRKSVTINTSSGATSSTPNESHAYGSSNGMKQQPIVLNHSVGSATAGLHSILQKKPVRPASAGVRRPTTSGENNNRAYSRGGSGPSMNTNVVKEGRHSSVIQQRAPTGSQQRHVADPRPPPRRPFSARAGGRGLVGGLAGGGRGGARRQKLPDDDLLRQLDLDCALLESWRPTLATNATLAPPPPPPPPPMEAPPRAAGTKKTSFQKISTCTKKATPPSATPGKQSRDVSAVYDGTSSVGLTRIHRYKVYTPPPESSEEEESESRSYQTSSRQSSYTSSDSRQTGNEEEDSDEENQNPDEEEEARRSRSHSSASSDRNAQREEEHESGQSDEEVSPTTPKSPGAAAAILSTSTNHSASSEDRNEDEQQYSSDSAHEEGDAHDELAGTQNRVTLPESSSAEDERTADRSEASRHSKASSSSKNSTGSRQSKKSNHASSKKSTGDERSSMTTSQKSNSKSDRSSASLKSNKSDGASATKPKSPLATPDDDDPDNREVFFTAQSEFLSPGVNRDLAGASKPPPLLTPRGAQKRAPAEASKNSPSDETFSLGATTSSQQSSFQIGEDTPQAAAISPGAQSLDASRSRRGGGKKNHKEHSDLVSPLAKSPSAHSAASTFSPAPSSTKSRSQSSLSSSGTTSSLSRTSSSSSGVSSSRSRSLESDRSESFSRSSSVASADSTAPSHSPAASTNLAQSPHTAVAAGESAAAKDEDPDTASTGIGESEPTKVFHNSGSPVAPASAAEDPSTTSSMSDRSPAVAPRAPVVSQSSSSNSESDDGVEDDYEDDDFEDD